MIADVLSVYADEVAVHKKSARNIKDQIETVLPAGKPYRNEEHAVAKAGIQVFEIVVVLNGLDARLRGHDEL